MPLHATHDKVIKKNGNWQPMVKIFEQAVVIPATPGAVLIDEEIHLGPYGLLATTYRMANFGYVIEKPDGNGGWVPTVDKRVPDLPSLPPNDPPGYEVDARIHPSPMHLPKFPGGAPTWPVPDYGISVGMDAGADWWCAAYSLPELAPAPDPEHRIVRARIRAVRTSLVYSPEDQALIDAYGYRLRVVLHAPYLTLWEKEVEITGNSGDIIMHEVVDLAQFDMVSDHSRFAFVADIRRNGVPIRTLLEREYVTGEAFDPPAPPVQISTVGVLPGAAWYNANNGPSLWPGQLYGGSGSWVEQSGVQPASQMGEAFYGGVLLGPELGDCAESVKDTIHVVAWRDGAMPTDYYDGTLAEGTLALTDADLAMDGTLVVRAAVPARSTVTVEFTPTEPELIGYDGGNPVFRYTWAVSRQTAVRVYFVPGTSTLQDAFTAITALADARVGTGTLNAPGYVFTQTEEFAVYGTAAPTQVPVPADADDGCTLRIRLIAAPLNRLMEYPFGQVSNDVGLRVQKFTPVLRDSLSASPGGLFLASDNQRLRYGNDQFAVQTEVPYILGGIQGIGSPQAWVAPIREGQGVSNVVVVPTAWPAGTAVESSFTVDGTTVYVTMTYGVTYYVLIWPSG